MFGTSRAECEGLSRREVAGRPPPPVLSLDLEVDTVILKGGKKDENLSVNQTENV